MRIGLVSLVLTIALCCSYASAQWKEIGPYVGRATCFVASGPRVFAGSSGEGVLLSTDNGASWTSVNTGLTDTDVTALTVCDTNLLAGTRTGVFLSTDNGTHWAPTLTGLSVYSFGVCETNVYVSGGDGGARVEVFLSSNGGASWMSASPPFAHFGSMTKLGSDVYATVADSIFRSSDNGVSWTWTSVIERFCGPFVALAAIDTNLFAGSRGYGVYRSTNKGVDWMAVNTGLTDTKVTALAVSGSNLFAGTDGGVFRSTDDGAGWEAVNDWQLRSAVFALTVSGATLFAGTPLGISVSTDNGFSWTIRNVGSSPDVGITALAARGPECFVATAWGGGSKSQIPVTTCVFHSTDSGGSWAPKLTADVSAIVIRDTDVFVGTGMGGIWMGRGPLRSTDRGANWTAVNQGFPKATGYGDTSGYAHISCFVSSGRTLFAGTYGSGVYATTNNGASWTSANTNLTTTYVWALAISGANLFAGTEDGGVFLSTNNGTSWSAVNTGLPVYQDRYPSIRCLAVSGTDVFAGGSGGVDTEYGGVFRSTDSGTSWTAVKTDFARHVLGLAAVGTNIFATVWCCDSMYLSTDDGDSWRGVCPVGEYGGGRVLVTNDTYVFAGTGGWSMWGAGGGGLLRRSLSELITSVDPVASDRPSEFLLQQNYPNPFNPSTTIKYGLPERSHVTLTIFNTLGQQLATLVNGEMEAGYHEVKFDATRLPSGVYLYRLQAGNRIEVRKSVLMR